MSTSAANKNASGTPVTTVRKWRERERLLSKLPVGEMIALRMDELGIKNPDLAAALDYPTANVIAMIKGGSMRLPETKIVAAADKLQIDRATFLRKVISENNLSMWNVIDKVLGPKIISANEHALLEFVRQQLDGHEVDLTQKPDFVQSLVAAIKPIVAREAATNLATMNRLNPKNAKTV